MDKEAVVPFPGQLHAELFEIFEQLNFFRQGFTMTIDPFSSERGMMSNTPYFSSRSLTAL